MRTLLLLAVAIALPGCAIMSKMSDGLKGSGTLVKKEISLSTFNQIEHSTVGQVIVILGNEQKVEVETDDNILPLLKAEVNGTKLELDSKESISPTKLVYHITVKELEAVELSGVGSLEASGIKGSELKAELSGVGSLQLSGATDRLDAEVSGVGGLNAFDLQAKDVKVTVSGTGGADVHATGTLIARCSGVGGIEYKGNPKVDAEASGIGKVKSAN